MRKINRTRIATDCPNTVTCNAVDVLDHDPDGVYVTGQQVTDPAVLASIPRAEHEATVRWPRELWEQRGGAVSA